MKTLDGNHLISNSSRPNLTNKKELYMITSTTVSCPPVLMGFNPNLLSMPIFGYNSEYLYEISVFIQKKIDSSEFCKFPKTIENLKNKKEYFMELYERAKTQERENKTKTHIKAKRLGYRPRLANRNDQSLFERLSDRAQTSKHDRRNNEISKIRKVK